MSRPSKPANPFRYFHSSPEVIRLVALMYIRFGVLRLAVIEADANRNALDDLGEVTRSRFERKQCERRCRTGRKAVHPAGQLRAAERIDAYGGALPGARGAIRHRLLAPA